MGKIVDTIVWCFFGAIALAIVFVKAGGGKGQNGGQQTADIISSFGTTGANLANALEGNKS